MIKKILEGTEFYAKTYMVGGCVRDLLLGRDPADIDLVTENKEGLLEFLKTSGYISGPIVEFPNSGATSFRLIGFDKDIELVEGDLSGHRDFTINSLYLPLSSDTPLDPTGRGITDIEDQVVHATFNAFLEDPLRILRGIRLAVTLGFEISKETWTEMCMKSWRLSDIPRERVTSELEKILTSPNPSRGLRIMELTGCLQGVCPELYQATKMTQNKYHIGTVWEHTVEVVNKCTGRGRIVLWSALFHDIGKLETKTEDSRGVHFLGHAEKGSEMCEDILRGLRLPGDDIKKIKILVARHMDFKHYAPGIPKDKKLRRYQYELGEDLYWMLLDLIEADNNSHAPGYCIEDQVTEIRKRTAQMLTYFDYTLPVSGADIMEVKKIGPTREVGKYLETCLKIACARPGITKEEILKQL